MALPWNQRPTARELFNLSNVNLDHIHALEAHVAEKLQCLREPDKPLNRHLVELLPHSAPLGFGIGDGEFACVAKMTPSTFWEFVGERLNIEKEHLPEGDFGSLVVAEQRETQLERSIKQGTRVRLHFLRVPHDLKLPLDATGVDSLPNQELLLKIKDSQRMRSMVFYFEDAEREGLALRGDSPEVFALRGTKGPEWLREVFAMRGKPTEQENARRAAAAAAAAAADVAEGVRLEARESNDDGQGTTANDDEQTPHANDAFRGAAENAEDDVASPVSSVPSEDESTMSSMDYVFCIYRLMTWAYCNGLLSERFKLLTPECVISLVDEAYERCIPGKLRNAFIGAGRDHTWDQQRMRNLIEVTFYPKLLGLGSLNGRFDVRSHSGRHLSAGMSVEATRALKVAVMNVMGSSQSPTPKAGYTTFAAQFDEYMMIQADYWIPRKLPTIIDHTISACLAIQQKLCHRATFAIRIWPSVFHDEQAQTLRLIMGMYYHERTGPSSKTSPASKTGPESKRQPIVQEGPRDGFDDLERNVNLAEILDAVPGIGKIFNIVADNAERHEILFPIEEDWIPADATGTVLTRLHGGDDPEPPNPSVPIPTPSASGTRTQASLPANPQPAAVATQHGTPAKKFRSAQSALDRLMWDDKHLSVQYEIGYADRFEGMMWKDLEAWQSLTEEEDFIPAHRVRVIRRKGGAGVDEDKGVGIVWDREGRVDEL